MLSIFERLLAHLQECLKCKEIKTFEWVLYFAKYQNVETITLKYISIWLLFNSMVLVGGKDIFFIAI